MCARATVRPWRVLYFAVDRAGSDPLAPGVESSAAHSQISACDRICSRPERHANVRDTGTVYDRDHPGRSLGYGRSGRDKSTHRYKQEEWPDDECEGVEIRPGLAFLRRHNRRRSSLAFYEYNRAVRQ